MICDNSNDCFDQSDEDPIMCHYYQCRCDFESDLCACWDQDIDSTAKWVVQKASVDAEGSLPSLDHSLATNEGHFLKLDGGNGSVSHLHSAVISGTSRNCSFRMWYQVQGNTPDSIKIYKRYSYYAGGLQLLAEIDNSVLGVWLKVNLELTNATAMDRYQVSRCIFYLLSFRKFVFHAITHLYLKIVRS
ncbi:MAM and LDL-receptor class A domain-containing protein 1 [Chionoecetes opilio]|uniref:MAM and LDL-receptor class A domain-containing protein 1 n=1 Tax=Chionoecetes opilio TaxID=41210 RepID=A0A8J4YF53_CHIOP|nr:MAM and LDL-receptor class A domain-containing protein 1 [Chionoecetes opilio]